MWRASIALDTNVNLSNLCLHLACNVDEYRLRLQVFIARCPLIPEANRPRYSVNRLIEC